MSGPAANRHVRAIRVVSLSVILGLSLMLFGSVASAYNNWDNMCGKWPNANPIGIQWKWDGDLNPSGWWGYAFASVAEPRWDDSYAKISLGYNSGAAGEYGVYYADDGWAGQAWAWCNYLCPCYIVDFLAEGNTQWRDGSSWDPYMGNVAGQEIGHTLGYGHSCCPAVMQQGYAGSWPTTDDNQGMRAMYP